MIRTMCGIMQLRGFRRFSGIRGCSHVWKEGLHFTIYHSIHHYIFCYIHWGEYFKRNDLASLLLWQQNYDTCELRVNLIYTSFRSRHAVQGSAKEWTLGCVKRAPVARGDQDAGITHPRDHSLADPCNKAAPI